MIVHPICEKLGLEISSTHLPVEPRTKDFKQNILSHKKTKETIETGHKKETKHTTEARDRLEICQKIYTTQFSGARILHTENA